MERVTGKETVIPAALHPPVNVRTGPRRRLPSTACWKARKQGSSQQARVILRLNVCLPRSEEVQNIQGGGEASGGRACDVCQGLPAPPTQDTLCPGNAISLGQEDRAPGLLGSGREGVGGSWDGAGDFQIISWTICADSSTRPSGKLCLRSGTYSLGRRTCSLEPL